MSNLSHVEEYLKASGATFEKIKDALVLNVQPGISIPLSVREEKHGWIEMRAVSPLGKNAKKTARLGKFIIEVEKVLGPGIKVWFDPVKKAFCTRRVFMGDTEVKEEVDGMLYTHECLYPLFSRVGETGTWDQILVRFAFFDPEEFHFE